MQIRSKVMQCFILRKHQISKIIDQCNKYCTTKLIFMCTSMCNMWRFYAKAWYSSYIYQYIQNIHFYYLNSKGYGPNVPSSTLQKATSSYCGFNSEKRTDLDFGFGSDTGGGLTVRLIRNVENLFGPITSFTGYYELNSSPSARIVLKVGGSPLAVNPQVRKNIYFIGDPVF